MPHIVIEHSKNIIEKPDLDEIGGRIHQIFLEVSDTFKLSSLRTRFVCDDYYMADGNKDSCFVHANIELLSGRAPEIKTKLLNTIVDYLCEYFKESIDKKNCLISTEIREIDATIYKYARPPV